VDRDKKPPNWGGGRGVLREDLGRVLCLISLVEFPIAGLGVGA
jgi:hypothetical protein